MSDLTKTDKWLTAGSVHLAKIAVEHFYDVIIYEVLKNLLLSPMSANGHNCERNYFYLVLAMVLVSILIEAGVLSKGLHRSSSFLA